MAHSTGAKQRAQNERQIGLDGRHWKPETEAKLNALALRVFSTGDGYELLNYLKNITLNCPLPPDATDGQLRHMEGQRYIVGVLMQRMQVAQGSEQTNVDAKPDVDGEDRPGS